jgi:ribosomal protein L28
MSKVCDICGKSTVAGNRIQHKHSIGWRYKAPKSKRKFRPNLRTIEVELDDTVKKVSACMKCYKRLRKEAAANEVS